MNKFPIPQIPSSARRFALCAVFLCNPATTVVAETHYTAEKVYFSRPDPGREMPFGHIGTTGLKIRIYKDVTLRVEDTMPGSPADGKFRKGEIITGVNGAAHRGHNPFVFFGEALTKAEAGDGRMVFDVTSADGASSRKETVTIPVLGAYSPTWPLDCGKSRKIIKQAADWYADPGKFRQGGIPGALACLFLLSTGDDAYLPRVKAYFDAFPKEVARIGDHTWNNGYNGIACAEYYLRTGDASVLPILQFYCDDAKRRQKFGCSWTHWGDDINPGYVASGLMNPAGAQVLTTLLLGKECGVNVDDKTLLGALRFFYRFAGRGTVPYGDHRGEGGLGSNGKDGMIAAAMQVAAGAKGDVTIYRNARRYLAMSMIDSYPLLVSGHGDDGRGDGIWRAIITSYLQDEKPELYRSSMDRLMWWHDLSREHGGSVGIATLAWENGVIGSSGPGIALSYTAPLKTLRITGAPRSKHAKDFTLPEALWGTRADQAFLSSDHHPRYYEHGVDEPAHIPFYALGGAYHQPAQDLKSLPREVMLKNVHHRNFMIRAQAAKSLRATGALHELEKLLSDPDPRLRRAARDGMTDYNYWFGHGRNPIRADDFTPGMLAAIRRMLADPEESWWVVDGALMALKFAPPMEINACKPLIMPWTKHGDWWLRESSFMALSGLEKDADLYQAILPKLLEMTTAEYHTQPRSRMMDHLERVLRAKQETSPAGKLIVSGLKRSVSESEIVAGPRSAEGAYNVAEAAAACLRHDPSTALALAKVIPGRFQLLGDGDLVRLLATPNSNRENPPFGLHTALAKQTPAAKTELADILYRDYRPEVAKRLKSAKERQPELLDTLIDLTQLREPAAGWQPVGKVKPAERVWRFISFDPQTEADRMPLREKKRFRDIRLPDGLEGWHEVAYDDSGWSQGRAPIGIGVFKGGGVSFENQSDWGRGEFIVMRTSFEFDALDFDAYRLSILARQGFRVFLNGHPIDTYVWWKDQPHYRTIPLGKGEIRHLKAGTNILAAYANVEYDHQTQQPVGQMDFFIEGLKMPELE
ncbi:MAG: DUF6288 domain-containing protein [Luteolibacter sp.]